MKLRIWRNWVSRRCENCGTIRNIKEDEYGYRYSYINDAGHTDYDFYCKFCGSNKHKGTMPE